MERKENESENNQRIPPVQQDTQTGEKNQDGLREQHVSNRELLDQLLNGGW